MIEQVLSKLRENGMRITEQRKALLLFLSEEKSSISIKDLYFALNKKRVKIDEASVYRIVEALKELNLVHVHSDGRINLCSHQSCSHFFHYSVECSKCKRITEPPLTPAEEKLLAKTFKLSVEEIKHIQVKASCKDCA